MGNIIRVFHRSTGLPPRKEARGLWMDIGENIHIHFRDMRLEFSESEYLEFSFHIGEMLKLFQEWRQTNTTWTESKDPENFKNEFVIWLGDYMPGTPRVNANSDYWDDRISVEENANGVFHIHYRNYRFEMDEAGFKRIVSAFREVPDKYNFDPSPNSATNQAKDRAFLKQFPYLHSFLSRSKRRIIGFLEAL